jgi:PAX-interacting protein 1
VTNTKSLVELLNSLAPNKYLVKTLSHDQVKVQPTESPLYTAIIKALIDRNTEFHTYKPRQDRSFRVVLKNLHPSTDVNDIKQALKEEGHEAPNMWNVKQRNTKHCPSTSLTLSHTPNKDIYKITTLLNTVVKVETPHTKCNIPQCLRCQKYGHTKNYCRNTPRCVKCA